MFKKLDCGLVINIEDISLITINDYNKYLYIDGMGWGNYYLREYIVVLKNDKSYKITKSDYDLLGEIILDKEKV